MPGFKVALDRLVGKQKMPRQAVVLGAGGGARAVVYGLITEGFQRIVVFNRHLHRAEGLVKHFGRSAAHMELRAMPWHESIIEAELAKTRVLVNATSIGLTGDETPDPGRDAAAGPAGAGPHLRPRRGSCATPRRPGATVADGELMLLHQGAAAFTLWTGQPAPLELMQRSSPRRAPAASGRPRASRPATPRPSRGAAADAADAPTDGTGARRDARTPRPTWAPSAS